MNTVALEQAGEQAGSLWRRISVTGGFEFNTYVVAFSKQAPHSYAVIGVANWKMYWVGSVDGTFIWSAVKCPNFFNPPFCEKRDGP